MGTGEDLAHTSPLGREPSSVPRNPARGDWMASGPRLLFGARIVLHCGRMASPNAHGGGHSAVSRLQVQGSSLSGKQCLCNDDGSGMGMEEAEPHRTETRWEPLPNLWRHCTDRFLAVR